jgi:hypothetical protein
MMPTTSELTVEIELQPDDIIDWWSLSGQNSLRWAMALFGCFLIFQTRAIWTSGHVGSNQEPLSFQIIFFLIGVVLLAFFFYPHFRVRSMFQESPALRHRRRVTFSSEGLQMESEDARGDYKWSLFNRIVETRKVFIFSPTGRGGVYVPKRCLANPNDAIILRQLIRNNFRGGCILRSN